MKNSILIKYISSFVIPIAIFSILFSLTLYFLSMNIINQHVIVQFEKSLKLIAEDSLKDIDTTLVEGANSDEKDKYAQLKMILEKYQQKHNVENTYVLAKTGSKEYIVALSNTDDQGTDYPFSDEMRKSLKNGTIEYSSIYDDEFGTHKSIFIPFEGTNMIFGIDMDASFIKDLKSMVFTISIALTIIFVGLGFVIAYIISKKITNPLISIRNYVNEVADGDLSIKEMHINGKDEIAQLSTGIQKMVLDLNGLINQIAENAEQVAATSEELMASSEETSSSVSQVTESMQEVATGAENQSHHIVEMNKSVAYITNGMQQITVSVNDATESSESASEIAVNGNKIIESSVEKMNVTYQTIKKTSDIVYRLSDYTKEIGDIVTLITQITDQTNLLALNASIEAARAGEHGKGFAVVAGEVRKLADQSKNAANEISSRIETIKLESTNAVESMSIGYHSLEEGLSTFEKAGQAFGDILHSVDGVSNKILAINSSIEDMNKGMQNISESMEELSAISTQSLGNVQNVAAASEEQTATIQEIAASSNNLATMAEVLREAVQKFKL
ncbi:methyl-accepting chemotaxis protein [Peribacillus sp. NPDC097675]|uniref:methyl-accepting chemotaxis protein n=1 Tax=Peribacillus sp. NPDC097675 TaxID=3390618 RepID=UPI003D081B6C